MKFLLKAVLISFCCLFVSTDIMAQTFTVNASSPILGQSDAQGICGPSCAAVQGQWDLQWWSNESTNVSFCQCTCTNGLTLCNNNTACCCTSGNMCNGICCSYGQQCMDGHCFSPPKK